MASRQFIAAPRIEVVLVPDEKDANVNSPTTLFDVWIVLHVPDGERPATIRLDDGPFDRRDAKLKLIEVWDYIGKKFVAPTAMR